MRSELFVIAPGLWKAASADEVEATCRDLRELGLYRLPYRNMTVRFRATELLTFSGAGPAYIDKDGHPVNDPYLAIDVRFAENEPPKVEALNELNGFRLDVTDNINVQLKDESPLSLDDFSQGEKTAAFCQLVCNFLVAMLATRNIVKKTTVDKLAQLGIGSKSKHKHKHRFTHTTTISLPRPEDMEDDHEHKPTGLHKAPHLRRGHIRHQHYGPERAFTKRIWIEPVFVNADPSFVSQRDHYNFGVHAA